MVVDRHTGTTALELWPQGARPAVEYTRDGITYSLRNSTFAGFVGHPTASTLAVAQACWTARIS
ncbi:hypothetical protein ACIGXA_39985 [Streptomyces fildesensis]|uniref:Uncharacterized protein n=1 Tax=Streptomyces fildesensis TaxID=375757 RepID=A0ABW8CJT6_9ACTN